MGPESSTKPVAKASSSKTAPAAAVSKPHITDLPITWSNWYQHVNWLNVYLIIGIPMAGLYWAAYTPLQTKTAIWAVLYYFATGLGITAGKFFLTTLIFSIWSSH